MPYYDKNHDRVYHLCTNCPAGRAIPEDDKQSGMPFGATRCAQCDTLKLQNKCEPEDADQ